MSDSTDESSDPGYRVWRAPRVGSAAAAVADAEASARAEARERGYDAGLAEGRAAGQQEVDARCQRLDALLHALARPLDTVEEQTERTLAELACQIAGQLVRRTMRHNPDEILPVVREAVATLEAASQAPEIRLHPDDAALVRDALNDSDGLGDWQVIEDGSLDAGDCVVRSGHASVDARLASRIQRVTDHVLDGGDGGPPSDAPTEDASS